MVAFGTVFQYSPPRSKNMEMEKQVEGALMGIDRALLKLSTDNPQIAYKRCSTMVLSCAVASVSPLDFGLDALCHQEIRSRHCDR